MTPVRNGWLPRARNPLGSATGRLCEGPLEGAHGVTRRGILRKKRRPGMRRGAFAAVYILTNERRTVLYTGVTADLARRLWEHRTHCDPKSFASRYHCTRLVFYEVATDIRAAITREKQIKNWHRAWKIRLVESANPDWLDLSARWMK